MTKKCVACGAPLDGFLGKIASLAGVRPSIKNPDYCNKCESRIPRTEPEVVATPMEEVKPEDLVVKAPVTDLFEDAEKKQD